MCILNLGLSPHKGFCNTNARAFLHTMICQWILNQRGGEAFVAKRFVLPQGTFPRRPDLLSHHRLRRPLSKREIASSNLAKSTLFIFSFFCPSSSSSSKKKKFP